MQKCKPHVDLGGVLAGLSRGEYSWIPHLLKDLNRIPKNAGVLWSEEPSEAGEAHRGAALQFARRVGDVWPGLVERCYEANALAASVSSSAPSSGVVDDENGATGGEEGPYSKQQLYPLPKEEDLNNWSHHSSLETVADPIFRRAMRGLPGAVSFVFGMYQDWQLIQVPKKVLEAVFSTGLTTTPRRGVFFVSPLCTRFRLESTEPPRPENTQADSALEAAKKAPPAATDDDEAEEGCACVGGGLRAFLDLRIRRHYQRRCVRRP
ncbi:hypothetical protein M885DRAFT_66855 [Pelagophyceae sp. CCMP2097]|nr:hypothetical protein M885DRAFT_66855 [Pelagophyceae sp. CCMP2097]